MIQAMLDGVGVGTAKEETLTDLIAKRTIDSGPRRLMPFLPRIFSLLSEPPESTR
jgi:hypothetical protein